MLVVRLLGCIFVLLVLGVVIACSGPEVARDAGEKAAGERDGQEEPAGKAGSGSVADSEDAGAGTNSADTTGSAEEQAQDTGQTSKASEPVLDEKWYVDSDGNVVPDFIEQELGYDPEVDDCTKKVNCPGPSGAGGTSAVDFVSKEQNTLLILDSSGSMAETIGGGESRMDAARASLERYATATPDFINLGFMVYGHKGSSDEADRAESCESTEVLKQPGEVDYETFPDTLQSFKPTGWTPIAGALKEAGDTFSGGEEATNRVILVSDGLETCGGDPVAAAQELADSDVQVTIDVVGFDIPQSEEEQLRRIAEVSGGRYATASTAEELQDYFDEQQSLYSELLTQWLCANDASNELYLCNSDFGNETYLLMSDISNNIYLDEVKDYEARSEAIDEIVGRADDYNTRIVEEADDLGEKRLKAINKDINEVRKRMQERYNEDVSFSPSCSNSPAYASLGKENAPGSVATALLTHRLSNLSGP